jgi:hypothetical protein
VSAVTPARRRLRRAAALGGLLALALDLLLLTAGHASLLRQPGALSDFYDVQGRAFLHGRLDVDPAKVGFEGFVAHGRTYLYYGPVPALLRMPLLAVTHGLDGRLTQLSMLLALVILLVAGIRVHEEVRQLVRADAVVGGADIAAAFALPFALGAGSIALFLASRPVVYNETELWGAGLAIAAVAAVLGVVSRPSGPAVALAGTLTALAVNTRVPVGLGPVLALLFLASGVAGRLAGPRLGRLGRGLATLAVRGPVRDDRRLLAALLAAAIVPVGTSAAVNVAKFGQPFGVPLDRQANVAIDPARQAALAANGGRLFAPRFVPTTLLAALRPDAVGSTRAFPFLGPPRARPTVVGDVVFDDLEPSLSAPTSMPAFVVLTVVGLVFLRRRRALRPLLAVLLGTAGGFAVTLTLAYTNSRYLADALPFVFLGATIGLETLLASRPSHGRVIAAALVALGLLGGAINGAAALVTQQLLNPETPEADRASFVATQDGVDQLLGRRPHGLAFGPVLPVAPGRPGDLFALDECGGLYVAGFAQWLPVERTDRSGLHRLSVAFPSSPPARAEALLTIGRGARRLTVVSRSAEGRATIELRAGGRMTARGASVPVPVGRHALVVVSFDPLGSGYFVSVRIDGRVAVSGPARYDPAAKRSLASDPGDPRLRDFGDSVLPLATPAPVCRRLVRRAELRIGG